MSDPTAEDLDARHAELLAEAAAQKADRDYRNAVYNTCTGDHNRIRQLRTKAGLPPDPSPAPPVETREDRLRAGYGLPPRK